MIELLFASGVIMLASLSGKLLVWRGAGAVIEKNLHFMVSFAAGVFLIFVFELWNEVFEHMELLPGLLWILGGALGVTLVCKLFAHTHKPEQEERHHHTHPRLDAHRMLVSDSVHNVGDGMLLAASYAVSPIIGIAATASVFVHEVVQEIAEFFVLRDAGYSVRRALMLNFLTSASILVGAVGGYFILELFEALEGPLLALTTGGVLSVIFLDLLPHSLRGARTKPLLIRHIFWILMGAAVMLAVAALIPHQHPSL